jgi:hypothetical protein
MTKKDEKSKKEDHEKAKEDQKVSSAGDQGRSQRAKKPSSTANGDKNEKDFLVKEKDVFENPKAEVIEDHHDRILRLSKSGDLQKQVDTIVEESTNIATDMIHDGYDPIVVASAYLAVVRKLYGLYLYKEDADLMYQMAKNMIENFKESVTLH